MKRHTYFYRSVSTLLSHGDVILVWHWARVDLYPQPCSIPPLEPILCRYLWKQYRDVVKKYGKRMVPSTWFGNFSRGPAPE